MRYAFIIMDGAADEPHDQYNGLTALEAAKIPNTDWIAQNGKFGLVRTVPAGMYPGSDVANMSLMGYNPKQYYTGRAPIEAAALGIHANPADCIFRCNLVTISDGIMLDHSAGHIPTVQSEKLITDLNKHLASDEFTFYPGTSYRHIMIWKNTDYKEVMSAPHDIVEQEVSRHMPKGKLGKKLIEIMEEAAEFLHNHDINKVRADLGENSAAHIWLWGQGTLPKFDNFKKKYGKSASLITAVDLLRGLARLSGMKVIEVEGATGFWDTNFAGKGQAAIQALAERDLIIVHIEAPDECGHAGNGAKKVESIENIDTHIVGPLLDYFKSSGDDWRIIVLPDHPTPLRNRTHTMDPVPFCIAGSGITGTDYGGYTEKNAAKTGMMIEQGHDLMEYFLKL